MTKLIYITHPSVKIDPQIPIEGWELSEKWLDPTLDEDQEQTGCFFITDLDNGTIIQDWIKY